MKLTVVTATFNCIRGGNGAKLQRCIESVSSLKCEHEHLIMDGASIDGTAELARRVGSEHNMNELHIFSEKDGGIYEALNKGLARAKGEWFYVLGSDDYISHPEVLDSLIVDVDSAVEMVVSPVEQDGREKYSYQAVRDLKKLMMFICYCHQGVLMRTSMLRKMNGFDERFRICADGCLFLRCHTSGVRIEYRKKPFANFAAGGMCESDHSRYLQENRKMLEIGLGISDSEVKHLESTWCIPMRIITKYLLSSDAGIRIASWFMLWMRLRHCVKRVLRLGVV